VRKVRHGCPGNGCIEGEARVSAHVEPVSAPSHPIDRSVGYYAITLTVAEDGTTWWSSQSEWIGQGSRPMWEMRRSSRVNPDAMRQAWSTLGMGCLVVNDQRTLAEFWCAGGNALIAEPVVIDEMPYVLESDEFVAAPRGGRPRLVTSLPKHVLLYAPSKKLRMAVIQRDRFRCKVCGRSPSTSVDIELNVHHILPWGLGGTTEKANLVTLCHTCHSGLDPHYTLELFGLIDEPDPRTEVTAESELREHDEGVARYRERVAPS